MNGVMEKLNIFFLLLGHFFRYVMDNSNLEREQIWDFGRVVFRHECVATYAGPLELLVSVLAQSFGVGDRSIGVAIQSLEKFALLLPGTFPDRPFGLSPTNCETEKGEFCSQRTHAGVHQRVAIRTTEVASDCPKHGRSWQLFPGSMRGYWNTQEGWHVARWSFMFPVSFWPWLVAVRHCGRHLADQYFLSGKCSSPLILIEQSTRYICASLPLVHFRVFGCIPVTDRAKIKSIGFVPT